MEKDQKRLQELSDSLQKTQEDLQSAVEARQKLESQQQENKSVQKEFNTLREDAGIYKLVGPVLLKQDRTEALNAVNGRLEFIGKEITRTELRIKELQERNDKGRGEIMQLQQNMQASPTGQVGVA